ncbi:MAG: M48 family metalloprotease, partial [Clostridia bacterium]|nr:M48 family metalloprotease [Clostridia bacterium]
NITRYPEGMIDALKKLQSHSQPMKSQNTAAAPMYINDPLRKGFFNNLFSTHPPIEKRIERLEHAVVIAAAVCGAVSAAKTESGKSETVRISASAKQTVLLIIFPPL